MRVSKVRRGVKAFTTGDLKLPHFSTSLRMSVCVCGTWLYECPEINGWKARITFGMVGNIQPYFFFPPCSFLEEAGVMLHCGQGQEDCPEV